jgi:hypothetical protein
MPYDEWVEDRDGHLIPQAGQDFPVLERVNARQVSEYASASTQTDGPSLPSPPVTEGSDGESEDAQSQRPTVGQLRLVRLVPDASIMIEEALRRTPTWRELMTQARNSPDATTQRREDSGGPMEFDGEENV